MRVIGIHTDSIDVQTHKQTICYKYSNRQYKYMFEHTIRQLNGLNHTLLQILHILKLQIIGGKIAFNDGWDYTCLVLKTDIQTSLLRGATTLAQIFG